jgi:transposase-like protein
LVVFSDDVENYIVSHGQSAIPLSGDTFSLFYILYKPTLTPYYIGIKTLSSSEELDIIRSAQRYAKGDTSRGILESMLWPNGPICPHCRNEQHKPIYKLKATERSRTSVRKGVYKCSACREQFTVTVGTVLEGSHISPSKWLTALFILCYSKKSVTASHLHRMLDLTYKTTWFMAKRIRFAMKHAPNIKPKSFYRTAKECGESSR